MLTRRDDVNNIEYWAYRLSEAEKASEPQYAVYLTNKTNWNAIWEVHKKIIKREIPKEAKVGDMGCGLGRVSELFENYTGVDFAPAFIEKAKALYPNKTFIVAKLEDLPFKDKEFDWAICISVKGMVIGKSSAEHWQKMESEIKRVSKKVLLLEYKFTDEFEIL
jgi:SAM-dependent methyltransferase